eukprot:12171457-Alexandrium_andersonii.AAC.1
MLALNDEPVQQVDVGSMESHNMALSGVRIRSVDSQKDLAGSTPYCTCALKQAWQRMRGTQQLQSAVEGLCM